MSTIWFGCTNTPGELPVVVESGVVVVMMSVSVVVVGDELVGVDFAIGVVAFAVPLGVQIILPEFGAVSLGCHDDVPGVFAGSDPALGFDGLFNSL